MPDKYHSLPRLIIKFIDPNNSAQCFRLYTVNFKLFRTAWGSSHNHQAWSGGYMHHVEQVMNFAARLYETMSSFQPLPFSLSDAMIVLYLHDVEKLWRGEVDAAVFSDKDRRHLFRMRKIGEYGIVLTADQQAAIKYTEGEGNDYSNQRRAMNPLAAFCHMCDVASARVWYDYPKPE